MATPDQGGLTRRDVIKRAGVIGAAAWTVPVLQTALAPAASASVPPDPCAGVCTVTCKCKAGSGTCSTNTQCATGTVCIGGVCRIPYGSTATCSSNAQCQSLNCVNGICGKAWTNTTCTQDNQCLSNKCNGGACSTSVLGYPCRATADCFDVTSCSVTTGTCGGTGATCQNKAKCLSEVCTNGVCQ